MKVFISSVVRGMEAYRNAARGAVAALGHQPMLAEQLPATSDTPERACLSEVRSAGAFILLLGTRYGDPQESGLSATHEEYLEARDRMPVFVFPQRSIKMENPQEQFLSEVQGWSTGHFTADFADVDELRDSITRALHAWELSHASGPVNPDEMVGRAHAMLTAASDNRHATIRIAVAGGPRQQVLRPAALEDTVFADRILNLALFGPARILTSESGTRPRISGHTLFLEQERSAIALDETGSVVVALPAVCDSGQHSLLSALVEEDIRESLRRGLRFIDEVLEDVDKLHRISDVAVGCGLFNAPYLGWCTREEAQRTFSVTIGGQRPDPVRVQLSPPSRKRAAFRHDLEQVAEDLLVLLRREVRQ